MNLMAAEELSVKRIMLTARDPVLLQPRSLLHTSTCSSKYDVSSPNVSKVWSSAEFRGRDAQTYFARADYVAISTIKVNDLLGNCRRHLRRQMKFTDRITKMMTNFAFFQFYTSLYPGKVQSPKMISRSVGWN